MPRNNQPDLEGNRETPRANRRSPFLVPEDDRRPYDDPPMLTEFAERAAEVEIENLPSDNPSADNNLTLTEIIEFGDPEPDQNVNPAGSGPSKNSPSVASEYAYTDSSAESSIKENEENDEHKDKEDKEETSTKKPRNTQETNDEETDLEIFPGLENDDREIGRERQPMLRSSRLSGLGFYDRLAAVSIRHLYGKGTGSRTQNSESYNIALSTLQRMVIHDLQRKLIFLVKRIVRRQEVSDAALKKARRLMAQYSGSIPIPCHDLSRTASG